MKTPEEQREYARGYTAGRRRRKRDMTDRQRVQQRAFLSALSFAMGAQGWTRGGEPIKSLSDRVGLAREIADESVRQMM